MASRGEMSCYIELYSPLRRQKHQQLRDVVVVRRRNRSLEVSGSWPSRKNAAHRGSSVTSISLREFSNVLGTAGRLHSIHSNTNRSLS